MIVILKCCTAFCASPNMQVTHAARRGEIGVTAQLLICILMQIYCSLTCSFTHYQAVPAYFTANKHISDKLANERCTLSVPRHAVDW